MPQSATPSSGRCGTAPTSPSSAAATLVIEAVFEDLATKRELMKWHDAVCADDAIFALNTSTLSITEIASGSKRPQRVLGMHFWLPAQLMELIEMSRAS